MGWISSKGKGSFGGEFGASQCNMHSCAKVREAMKLSFKVVSGVSIGIRVLDT